MTPISSAVRRIPEAAVARLGLALRGAQKAYYFKRLKHKEAECVEEAAKAREQQELFDALCLAAPAAPLARLGTAMRDAQKRAAEKLRKLPESQCVAELAQARALQAKFEAACREVLDAEQPVLPGLEGGVT